MLRKIKFAQRFPDLESAFGFAEENKIAYDEVILLFSHAQEVPEEEETPEQKEVAELPKHEVDKDKVIQELMKENAELKEFQEHGEEKAGIPKPPKPVKRGFLGKKAPTEKTEIRETK